MSEVAVLAGRLCRRRVRGEGRMNARNHPWTERLVPVAWLLICGPSGPLAAAERVSECSELVGRVPGSGSERLELHGPGEARLLYLGVVHGRDPADPRWRNLEEEFGRFAPTRVFYEGHSESWNADRDATLRLHGEPGLVRRLAAQAGLPAASLEPPAAAEVAALLELAEPLDVELFYVLRETRRLRDEEGLRHERLEDAVAALLAARGLPGLADELDAVADVEREFWARWSYPLRWQDPPAEWFDPLRESSATGGHFTNELTRTVASVRDGHMFEALAGALAAGHRVFAVSGANHVRAQAAALRCLADDFR